MGEREFITNNSMRSPGRRLRLEGNVTRQNPVAVLLCSLFCRRESNFGRLGTSPTRGGRLLQGPPQYSTQQAKSTRAVRIVGTARLSVGRLHCLNGFFTSPEPATSQEHQTHSPTLACICVSPDFAHKILDWMSKAGYQLRASASFVAARCELLLSLSRVAISRLFLCISTACSCLSSACVHVCLQVYQRAYA